MSPGSRNRLLAFSERTRLALHSSLPVFYEITEDEANQVVERIRRIAAEK
jgi:hypothetical protein